MSTTLCICLHTSHTTHKSIWINKSSMNPKSTSNQSSKPCRVLQYPSTQLCIYLHSNDMCRTCSFVTHSHFFHHELMSCMTHSWLIRISSITIDTAYIYTTTICVEPATCHMCLCDEHHSLHISTHIAHITDMMCAVMYTTTWLHTSMTAHIISVTCHISDIHDCTHHITLQHTATVAVHEVDTHRTCVHTSHISLIWCVQSCIWLQSYVNMCVHIYVYI